MTDLAGKDYLRRAEAAQYLQQRYGCYTVQSLAVLACKGGGPVYSKIGKFPLYRPTDLDSWMQSRMTRRVAHNGELAVA